MIDSYGFGRIVVDKMNYDADLIVFPDGVQPGWRRKEGHLLEWEDIRHAESTEKAVKRFNRLLGKGSKVIGAFHLTC